MTHYHLLFVQCDYKGEVTARMATLANQAEADECIAGIFGEYSEEQALTQDPDPYDWGFLLSTGAVAFVECEVVFSPELCKTRMLLIDIPACSARWYQETLPWVLIAWAKDQYDTKLRADFPSNEQAERVMKWRNELLKKRMRNA